MGSSSEYVIVTAVKNEAPMLEGLFRSVTGQTLRPSLWLIAEDGSSDDSYSRAKSLSSGHSWIRIATREAIQGPFWVKPNSAAAFGISEATKECSLQGIEYDMIGVLDADTTVDSDYFSRLVSLMTSRSEVAIASGLIATEGGRGLESRPSARGCARLYRRRFLESVGGFPVVASSDTVLEIKARNRGMVFAVDSEARGLHRRKSSNIADAKGLRSLGIIRYTMGMDLISAVAWSALYARSLGLRRGMSFIRGYIEACRNRYPRTTDAEVLNHFRGSWRRFLTASDTRKAVREVLAVEV